MDLALAGGGVRHRPDDLDRPHSLPRATAAAEPASTGAKPPALSWTMVRTCIPESDQFVTLAVASRHRTQSIEIGHPLPTQGAGIPETVGSAQTASVGVTPSCPLRPAPLDDVIYKRWLSDFLATRKMVAIDPDQEWFWTAGWQAAERAAEENLVHGRVVTSRPGETASDALRRAAASTDDENCHENTDDKTGGSA